MEPMRLVFQLSTFFLFVLPMTAISVLYILIGLTIRKSAETINNSQRRSGVSPKQQPRKAVLKMLGKIRQQSSVFILLYLEIILYYIQQRSTSRADS